MVSGYYYLKLIFFKQISLTNSIARKLKVDLEVIAINR